MVFGIIPKNYFIIIMVIMTIVGLTIGYFDSKKKDKMEEYKEHFHKIVGVAIILPLALLAIIIVLTGVITILDSILELGLIVLCIIILLLFILFHII